MRIIIDFLTGLICITAVNCLYAQQNRDVPQIVDRRGNTDRYSPQSRKFTGIPSLAVAPGGRMWATWYAGIMPDEDQNNYVVLSTSADGGNTWEEVMVVDPDGAGPLRAFDPQVWIAPDHSLWFFYAIGGRRNTTDPVDTWFMKTADPDDKNAVWSDQHLLATGVMMDKPTALTSGDWLFPVALWGDKKVKSDPAHDNSAKVYSSRDKGATFSLLGACNLPAEARAFDEHILVERKNGSLWMLVRTTYGIGESVSTDRGKTWSELQPSKIMHTSSRFFITRLSSGNLLLVKNGPVDVKTNRSHMMTFISKDDGLTWSRGLLLDERLGTSYPDGQQTKDDRIHIIYDFSRTNDQLILKTDFTEADILDPIYDEAMVRVFNNRKTVSKGGK